MKGNCPMSCQSAPSTKQLHQLLLCWANLCTPSGDARLDSQCEPDCNTPLLSLLSRLSLCTMSYIISHHCCLFCPTLLAQCNFPASGGMHSGSRHCDHPPEAARSYFKCQSTSCMLREPTIQTSTIQACVFGP